MDSSDYLENEKLQAVTSFKAYLSKSSTKTNLNLYDHLARVLMKVMDERPENVVDIIEEISFEVKRGLLQFKQDTLLDTTLATASELIADQQKELFNRPPENDGFTEEELVETPLPNVAELSFYLEQAGVGLGREEMQRILLGLKQLVNTQPLQRCRFWGKILGIDANYLVAEVEYAEGEEEEVEQMEESLEDIEKDDDAQEDGEPGETLGEEDVLPKSKYMPPPTIPKELHRTGANKYVYFVCEKPGSAWTRLPHVTPAQIIAARQMRKLFSGHLDAPIVSYPPFPGNETNYLRAQIARISAGTQVSPLGFYQFAEDEDEEEEEGEEGVREIMENSDFEGNSVPEMIKSLSMWVHHIAHILKQGRCEYVNIAVKKAARSSDDDEEEEEEEEEVEEESEDAESKTGPPLLTPLSEDAEINNMVPWTTRYSSNLIPQFGLAVIRSNLWPGAYAYACNKKFENIYIGWGMKYSGDGYTPPLVPQPQTEYPVGPEITETLDPTVEEEHALQEALEQRQAELEGNEALEDDEEEEQSD